VRDDCIEEDGDGVPAPEGDGKGEGEGKVTKGKRESIKGC
jgi:hypothetical protein